MKLFVRLENDVVVEIIDNLDSIDGLFHPSINWMEVKNKSVQLGQKLVNGNFVETEVNLDELAITERAWRDSELFRADIELNKVQDADKSAFGTVTVWREYRKSLRDYPQSQGFPNSSERPVSPDNK